MFATAYRNKNVHLFLNNLIVLVCNFCFSNSPYNKENIFLGLIEYELNSLFGAPHLVDYISIHIRFDLERYLTLFNSLASHGNHTTMCSATMRKTGKQANLGLFFHCLSEFYDWKFLRTFRRLSLSVL